MVLRGNKIAEPRQRREERCSGGRLSLLLPPHYCPSAGGESEEFPGRAGRKRRPRCGGCTERRARLPLLFSAEWPRNKRSRGKSRKLSNIIRLQRELSEETIFHTHNNSVCVCVWAWESYVGNLTLQWFPIKLDLYVLISPNNKLINVIGRCAQRKNSEEIALELIF